MYLAAGGNSSLDQGRSAPGHVLLKSPVRTVILAETDVVTRMLVARVEVEDIDTHLFSRNVEFLLTQPAQSEQVGFAPDDLVPIGHELR